MMMNTLIKLSSFNTCLCDRNIKCRTRSPTDELNELNIDLQF